MNQVLLVRTPQSITTMRHLTPQVRDMTALISRIIRMHDHQQRHLNRPKRYHRCRHNSSRNSNRSHRDIILRRSPQSHRLVRNNRPLSGDKYSPVMLSLNSNSGSSRSSNFSSLGLPTARSFRLNSEV